MPRPGDNIHIPLPEAEALRLLLQVKPTADMPRPGAHPMKGETEAGEEGFPIFWAESPLAQ